MKRILRWIVVLGIIGGVSAVGYSNFFVSRHSADDYRTAKAQRGDITFTIKSSGTVQPVLSVQIGAVVSGPLQRVYVDFNDRVKKGQLLAEIDPLLFQAGVDQAAASLACNEANLQQAKAKLEQAKREWKRAQELLPEKAIADTDYDTSKSNYESAEANVAVCMAQIRQSQGALDLAKTNLKYTKILSPVNGVITDRKVDPGQSLASSYQTPVLFVVAPDLEKRVYVLASVDEADIGLIRDAKTRRQPVTFAVEAYPKDKFQGTIRDIRLTPTMVQNIVTYTVVIEAANPELKLLPGMTPTLTFQIETRTKVLKIPNAALRFFPKPEQVRPCDRSILEGKTSDEPDKRKDAGSSQSNSSKSDSARPSDADADANAETTESNRKERYVWVVNGELLSAVKVTTGLSDDKFTEVVSGKLQEGKLLATGTKQHSTK